MISPAPFTHLWHRCASLLLLAAPVLGESAFQAYNAGGENLIHITTADLDGTGTKDHVVVMSTEGTVLAYPSPASIQNPDTDARIWEFSDGPSMGIALEAADALPDSPGDEILLPGTDGHLRILSARGELLADWEVCKAALYTAEVGRTSTGEARILTGGVDGTLYAYQPDGTQLAALPLVATPSLLTQIIPGDFDGTGGDELMLFFSISRQNNRFDCLDLDALDGSRPSYWKPTRSLRDSMVQLGWTNRQLPEAYDIDGDGNDELVGHWGILHPELGRNGKYLSDLTNEGELLNLRDYNRSPHKFTKTGKYLFHLGAPGRFKTSTSAYIATVYGDDLYLLSHDAQQKHVSIDDYSYAPPAYHFSGAARLEDPQGGPDKLVLAGPITGDDHFYLADLSNDSWQEAIKQIGGRGRLGQIAHSYAAMREAIDPFAGTVASPPTTPIYFRTAMGGWICPEGELTDAQIEHYVDRVAANMQEWYDIIGGKPDYQTTRIKLVCTGAIRELNAHNPIETQLEICREFARRGIHFNLHWDRWMCREPETYPPSMLADLFEASLTNGVCHAHFMAGEFNVEWFATENFQPSFDALLERADQLGVAPPNYLFSVKGPQWHKMSPEAWNAVFPKYSRLIVPSVENSSHREPALSLSERVGMWLKGDVKAWGSKTIGDNLTPSRIMEWGGMRNAHMVFRHMLSQYALGARHFGIVSVTASKNPLYERGDTEDPAEEWTATYRDGVFSFLKLIERGIYPAAPEPEQLLGLSPVALAINEPNHQRLTRPGGWPEYRSAEGNYVIGQLHPWDAYCDVLPTDATHYLFNSKRRWDTLFPTSPAGFIPTLPFTSRDQAETFTWCDRAFETNLDRWTEFDDLIQARKSIWRELNDRRAAQPFNVSGDCFWQLTRDHIDPNRAFLLLMDANALSPQAQTIELSMAAATGSWVLYDQLSASKEPLATLSLKEQRTSLTIDIPAGGVRLLVLKRF